MKTTWMEVVFFSVYKMSGCESRVKAVYPLVCEGFDAVSQQSPFKKN